MAIVLRALLTRTELRAADGGVEFSRRRAITVSPSGGARAVLSARDPVPAAEPATA